MPRGGETAGAARAEAESLSRRGSGLETADQRDNSEDAERRSIRGLTEGGRCRLRSGWVMYGEPRVGSERRSGCCVTSDGRTEDKAGVCVMSYTWEASTAAHSSDVQGQSRCTVAGKRLGFQVREALARDGFEPWH